ncbi:MAG: tetratricopeptide repeat protein [Capsulimonadaceae bacterium]
MPTKAPSRAGELRRGSKHDANRAGEQPTAVAAGGCPGPVPSTTLSRADWFLPLVLAGIVLAVYGRVCGYAFAVWDDTTHITKNPFFNPISPHALPHFWSQPHIGLYIPITYTVWTALCVASRLHTPIVVPGLGPIAYDARVFHSANLVVHVASTLLSYFLIRRLLAARPGERTPGPSLKGGETLAQGTQVRYAAAAGALLFGLHPVQVESVAWISEMKGLLSGLFALIALDQYVRFRLSPVIVTPSRRSARGSGARGANGFARMRRPSGHFVAATAALIAAVLSKPSAIGVPLIAAAIDVFFLRISWRAAVRALWPWGFVMAAAAWIGRVAQPSIDPSFHVALWARPLIVGDTLAFYAGHLIAPIKLGLDYGRQPQIVLQHPVVYVIWIVPAAIGALLAWQRRRHPELLGGALIMIAATLPVLGLIPFDFQAISTVADRYLYLAMLGPSLALGVLMCRATEPTAGDAALNVGRRSLPACVAAATLLVLCAVRSAQQVPTWRDSLALCRHALLVNPNSWMAWSDEGAIATNSNDTVDALADFRHAVAAKPDDERCLRYLGKIYRARGESDKELDLYRQTIQAHPTCGSAHLLLGMRLTLDGNRAGGETEIREALRLDPTDSDAHNALGESLLADGNNDEAAGEFRTFKSLMPYEPMACVQLARALYATGQYSEAADQARRAIELAPNDPYGYFHLAKALNAIQDANGAISAYRESIRYKGDIASTHSNLAAVLRGQGRLPEAVSEWREALRCAPGDAAIHDDLAGTLQQTGDTSGAIAEFQAALRLNPADTVAQAALTKPGSH